MRRFKLWVLALAFASTGVLAGPREEALQVVDQWLKAFSASDVEAITALYAPEAVFLGTGSKSIVKQPEDVRRYFAGAFQGGRVWTASLLDTQSLVVSDTVVSITALDKLGLAVDGKSQDLLGRVSFVIARRDAGWKIVSFHRSALPS